MPPEELPSAPSLSWRAGSAVVMGLVGTLCRTFMYGFNSAEIHGLEKFKNILDEREDVEARKRGLITVSNHVSVLDDPLIWGALPFRYHFNPNNSRWCLGSYDIIMKNSVLERFFSLGQTLPTHRLAHSPYGGLFQPTMTQAVRLLSHGPFLTPTPSPSTATPSAPEREEAQSIRARDLPDPFTHAHLTYTTNHLDAFPAPSAYASRRHSWIHIFPEGKIHQHSDRAMRYFKWGVSRLILEAEPCPDIVPIWIEGTEQVMHEARQWPRFVPRAGKKLVIVFGDKVDGEKVFGDLRSKWRSLVRKDSDGHRSVVDVGVLSEQLKHGQEAVELRKECTMRVRGEILKIRRQRGLSDEDPKFGLVETWAAEGGKREGKMEDGSWVKDT